MFEEAGGSYEVALKAARQLAAKQKADRDAKSLCEIANVDLDTAIKALKEASGNVNVAAEKLLSSGERRPARSNGPVVDEPDSEDEWAQVCVREVFSFCLRVHAVCVSCGAQMARTRGHRCVRDSVLYARACVCVCSRLMGCARHFPSYELACLLCAVAACVMFVFLCRHELCLSARGVRLLRRRRLRTLGAKLCAQQFPPHNHRHSFLIASV